MSLDAVAIVGITGALGREIQVALETDPDGIGRFLPIAGARSAGQSVRWRAASLPVMGLGDVAARDIDIALLACPADVARREAPRLLHAGARIIDASGALGTTPTAAGLDHPATCHWPRIASSKPDYELARAFVLPSPIASTLAPILEAVVLAALTRAMPIPALQSVEVTALMGASHAGRDGIGALSRQAVGLLSSQPVLDPRPFPHGLAFNVIAPSGSDAVVLEARAIDDLVRLIPALGAKPGGPTIAIQPLWVPVFSGLALTITLRFASPVSVDAVTRALRSHPDLELALATENRADAANAPVAEARDDGADAEPDASDDLDEDAIDAPDALGLRDTVDRDPVRLNHPVAGAPHEIRLVAMADTLHRTALAAQLMLAAWQAALEADEADA